MRGRYPTSSRSESPIRNGRRYGRTMPMPPAMPCIMPVTAVEAKPSGTWARTAGSTSETKKSIMGGSSAFPARKMMLKNP